MHWTSTLTTDDDSLFISTRTNSDGIKVIIYDFRKSFLVRL